MKSYIFKVFNRDLILKRHPEPQNVITRNNLINFIN